MIKRVEHIGDTTLYLGNSLDILQELKGPFSALVTDPPYSSGGMFKGDRASRTAAKYAGNNSCHADFSGDTRDQRSFVLWSSLWLERGRKLCAPSALSVVFTDWRQLPTTTDALQCGGWVWRGVGVWDKTLCCRPNKGGFRHQSEFFVWASKGPMNRVNQYAPGVFRAAPLSEKKYHMAGKPVALMEMITPLCGNHILDPFMGSGTVGVACVRQGLRYTGIEIDPQSFDIACERIRKAYEELSGNSVEKAV